MAIGTKHVITGLDVFLTVSEKEMIELCNACSSSALRTGKKSTRFNTNLV